MHTSHLSKGQEMCYVLNLLACAARPDLYKALVLCCVLKLLACTSC